MVEQIKTASEQIQEHIHHLQARIQQARSRSDRPAASVRCVAISKGHPAEAIRAAVAAGLTDIGENRVQEALAKAPDVSDLSIRWHLVGSLQANKIRHALKLFGMIQSLDRKDIAEALNKECEKQNRRVDVLIQAEATAEPTKHGFKPEAVAPMAAAFQNLRGLNLRGLMAIGPLTEDRQKIRTCFKTVRELYEPLRARFGESFDTLSMGMSGDFEIAIEEGANLIRIGTLIFGTRSQK